jgi:hypothetical protein
MNNVDANSHTAKKRRGLRFSLKQLVVLVTGIAILVNLALAQPTREFASIVRLIIASALLVGGALYLIDQLDDTITWQRWLTRLLYVAVAWGLVIVLGTSTFVLGMLLYRVLGAA